MVNAQEWLDKWYPKKEDCLRENESEYNNNFNKKRSEIEKLDIHEQNLEGSLDLSDFSSLKMLDCSNNYLTELTLNNCFQLEEIICDNNNLSNLNLSNFSNLKRLWCNSNELADFNFLTTLSQQRNLEELNIRDNRFTSDLSWLTPLVNLELLSLKNNNFRGSLKPLQNLTKLEILHISNTNLNSGTEYLPESLEQIYYSTDESDKLYYRVSQIEEQLDNKYWVDIHEEFQPSDKKAWEKQGFNKEQTKKWIDSGATPSSINDEEITKSFLQFSDHDFASSEIEDNQSESEYQPEHQTYIEQPPK